MPNETEPAAIARQRWRSPRSWVTDLAADPVIDLDVYRRIIEDGTRVMSPRPTRSISSCDRTWPT